MTIFDFINQDKITFFFIKSISKSFPLPSPNETYALPFDFVLERDPRNIYYQRDVGNYTDLVLDFLLFDKRFFFSSGFFFHEHSRITELQGKGEGISLSPHYQFHSLHRHLGINRANTAGSSPLHIASSRTRTGNLWFASASR